MKADSHKFIPIIGEFWTFDRTGLDKLNCDVCVGVGVFVVIEENVLKRGEAPLNVFKIFKSPLGVFTSQTQPHPIMASTWTSNNLLKLVQEVKDSSMALNKKSGGLSRTLASFIYKV